MVEDTVSGDFARAMPLAWMTVPVKRVARSTLMSEAHAAWSMGQGYVA